METDRENTGKCCSEQQQRQHQTQQQQQQQQQTLDFMVNLGNKQDDRESDGAMHDETPPSPPLPGDDVAPDAVDDGGVDVIRDPDYAEERFRVDRRKLEQLIQGWSVDVDNVSITR